LLRKFSVIARTRRRLIKSLKNIEAGLLYFLGILFNDTAIQYENKKVSILSKNKKIAQHRVGRCGHILLVMSVYIPTATASPDETHPCKKWFQIKKLAIAKKTKKPVAVVKAKILNFDIIISSFVMNLGQ
jgi:hypothetical protein